MNMTTLIDIENRVCEYRVYSARLNGRELHIECPYCGEHSQIVFEDLFSHHINCGCGALLTWWYAAYQKKNITHD